MSEIDRINTLFSRASGIAGVKTAKKRAWKFNSDELPGVSVYSGPSDVTDAVIGAQSMLSVPLVVEYTKAATTADPMTEGYAMADEIIAAVEVDDVYTCEPFILGGKSVATPDADSDIITVQVNFVVTVHHTYGG